MTEFGPIELLNCYAQGVFPMADSRDDPRIFLHDPEFRGIIPLDGLHISKSMAKLLRRQDFDFRINSDFEGTVRLCAQAAPDRPDTWINEGIIALYTQLHEIGHAHSVEIYREDDFIGGLYGVSLGTGFFGESMFSRAPNASKIALVILVERLKARGFTLLDTQFITDHLRTLGGIEISRAEYRVLLAKALTAQADFD